MLESLKLFVVENWRAAVEVFILTVIVYCGYLSFHKTRGARILIGLLLVLMLLTVVSALLQLQVIGWLLQRFYIFLAIALVVLFQPELRRVLAQLGSHRLFSLVRLERHLVQQLHEAVVLLSHRRFGALFAIERDIDLRPYLDTGIELDARFSPELVLSIFHPRTALHDGGMILRKNRILGAGCVFPLSQVEVNDRSIGLRHRAAMGLSEESGAVVIAVSEETGHISISTEGQLEQNVDPDAFAERLTELLGLTDYMHEKLDSEQLAHKARIASSGAGDMVPRQGTSSETQRVATADND